MELNRDGDGFLVNTNDWSEEVMNQMASEDDFEITEEIFFMGANRFAKGRKTFGGVEMERDVLSNEKDLGRPVFSTGQKEN